MCDETVLDFVFSQNFVSSLPKQNLTIVESNKTYNPNECQNLLTDY